MLLKISPIIKAEELILLKQKKDLILIDARAGIGAKEKFTSEHLRGARFVNLEGDLATPTKNPANGGRHPLPDIAHFSEVLQKLGITPQSHVVVYDDKNGANAAARFWWMLRSVGHTCVQVLDGGLNAAVLAGVPISDKVESVKKTFYPINKWILPRADINQVEENTQNSKFIIIDVRDAERYRGEKEPIDLTAGHIPCAINIPFTGSLDENGFFLPATELRDKFIKIIGNRTREQVIVHCGSGVTACHTLLAMDFSGLGIPTLYVGSWSEWSRTNRPIATGDKT